MIARTVLFILIGLGWLCSCTSGRIMSEEDISYRYNPGMAIKYELRAEGDSLHIFLLFENDNMFGSRSDSDLRMSYAVKPGYESKKAITADSVPAFLKKSALVQKVKQFDFKLPLSQLPVNSLLILKWQSDSDPAVFLDIPLTSQVLGKKYLILNPANRQLYFRNYFNLQESVMFELSGPNLTFTLKEFETSFAAARPPMDLTVPNQAKTMTLRNSLPWFADQAIVHTKKGLFQADFSDNGTCGFLVEENAFPKLTTAAELIQPLIYLTTNSEREKLYSALDPKAAVDDFWLKTGGSAATARYLIKTYYGRVEEANSLFSAHKAGWLTDQGMLYIVFGPPERVYRTNTTEAWIYTGLETIGSMQFVFQKKQNNFTQNYYELIRSRAFEYAWYSIVEKWRNGITDQ